MLHQVSSSSTKWSTHVNGTNRNLPRRQILLFEVDHGRRQTRQRRRDILEFPSRHGGGRSARRLHSELGLQKYFREDGSPRTTVVKQVPQLKEGYLQIPGTRSIGMELDDHGIAGLAHNPNNGDRSTREDGSVAFR
ncbi:MAG: hypothetical protein CL879_01640 [Dehalococcoidia bacterium]|nr:hypothetical protein [Dehalococcoidia bacterium]